MLQKAMLLAGIGIEFRTRRRHKLAGLVLRLEQTEERTMQLDVEVNEAIGDYTKYNPPQTRRRFGLLSRHEHQYAISPTVNSSSMQSRPIAFIAVSDILYSFGRHTKSSLTNPPPSSSLCIPSIALFIFGPSLDLDITPGPSSGQFAAHRRSRVAY
ncbi:hypothetical protein R3P38DRAFT_1276969 [Favolaschia claudopus]|uniref:Uncharacterized protein n=1 Tax=Favolaschia claudopus TaxID=2862362 RepID=A0AAW0B1C6_9AGAR